MARGKPICDICKKETDEIVAKLFKSPARRANPSRAPHSDYTHHLDVGACCEAKLMRGFNWQPRLTAKQYADKRKKKAAPA